MGTFYQWLQMRFGEDTPVGDLARDVKEDGMITGRAKEEFSVDMWQAYFRSRGMHHTVWPVFSEAVDAYQKECRTWKSRLQWIP